MYWVSKIKGSFLCYVKEEPYGIVFEDTTAQEWCYATVTGLAGVAPTLREAQEIVESTL